MVCEDFGITPKDSAQQKLPYVENKFKEISNNSIGKFDVSEALRKNSSRRTAKQQHGEQINLARGVGIREIQDLMFRPDFRADMQRVDKGEMTFEQLKKKYHF